MGIHDRDYVWGSQRRGGLAGSVNAWLIGVNVVIFVLQLMTTPQGLPLVAGTVGRLGYLSTAMVLPKGGLEFWRFLTFQFLHANMMHILFNMFGLWVFGRQVEEHLGSKRYLAFYLTCGAAGGMAYFLLNALGNAFYGMNWPMIPGLIFHDTRVPLVGASAGVFGVIMACAYQSPNTVVQLMFPPIPLRMRTMAYAYVGISLASLLLGTANQGGEAAHLGGAIAGYFLIRNHHVLRDFFDVFSDSRKPPKPTRKPAKQNEWISKREQTLRSAQEEAAEVDRILAKVKAETIASLTAKERETLHRASQKDAPPGAA